MRHCTLFIFALLYSGSKNVCTHTHLKYQLELHTQALHAAAIRFSGLHTPGTWNLERLVPYKSIQHSFHQGKFSHFGVCLHGSVCMLVQSILRCQLNLHVFRGGNHQGNFWYRPMGFIWILVEFLRNYYDFCHCIFGVSWKWNFVGHIFGQWCYPFMSLPTVFTDQELNIVSKRYDINKYSTCFCCRNRPRDAFNVRKHFTKGNRGK